MKRYYGLLEVICAMDSNHNVTPIRFRFENEDGLKEVHKIKSFSYSVAEQTKTMPDGVYVKAGTYIFECNIETIAGIKQIVLYYLLDKSEWILCY